MLRANPSTSIVPIEYAHATHTEEVKATLPGVTDLPNKVIRVIYTNEGNGILVFLSNGLQRIWKWDCTENPTRTDLQPGFAMMNDIENVDLRKSVPCIALSKDDTLVVSAAGGKISVFNMETSTLVKTFEGAPPASTYIAFNPLNSDIVAIGMEDSTIHIHNIQSLKVYDILKGHTKSITGLVFSSYLGMLVSCGADSKIIAWCTKKWKKMKSFTFPQRSGNGDMHIQFHLDNIHLLASNEGKMATYNMEKMKGLNQWEPKTKVHALITFAAYNCNCSSVFVGFRDARIGVFETEKLKPIYFINPSYYLTREIPISRSCPIFPHFLAAHPRKQDHLAVCMIDGSLILIDVTAASRLSTWGWGNM